MSVADLRGPHEPVPLYINTPPQRSIRECWYLPPPINGVSGPATVNV